MSYPIKSPRKLIEVALPLDAINAAAAEEKGNPFLKGHPRNLHQWWARRPMAAARAVIFAQLVNDPGYQQGGGFKYGMNKNDAAKERKRLFKIIEDLVLWENTSNEAVLERARSEIRRSWREVCELNKDHPQATELFNPDNHPALHDPFAGGGAIPLEAQRLGLAAYASDLNPVAVLINKVMIEIPPLFSGRSPVRPSEKGQLSTINAQRTWLGASGLAEDVRYYGAWMQAEAQKRIGHLYPPVEITAEMARERSDLKPLVGQKLTVVSWLWARTIKSPNPAFSHVDVPLVSTFALSQKKGKEAYLEPVIDGDSYRFQVKTGSTPSDLKSGTKSTGARSSFLCLLSQVPIDFAYIRSEAKAGRMKHELIAIVAETVRGRVFLDASMDQVAVAKAVVPDWRPESLLPEKALSFRVQEYGMLKWGDLFTPRQLVSLTTFSDLIGAARSQIIQDTLLAGGVPDETRLDASGTGTTAYADAVSSILALGLGKAADYNNALCTWNIINQNIGHLFTKQSVPMTWDYPETTLLSGGLSFENIADGIARTISQLPAQHQGFAFQCNCSQIENSSPRVISTDPPYYDNIGYSDLSDFFYVWHRRALKGIHPQLFTTLTTPKSEELVATPFRHSSKDQAEQFFLNGMTAAMRRLASVAHAAFPITIYYAFKQSETKDEGTVSRGWVTFLEAVFRSGLTLDGTWPMRTERAARAVGLDTNSLASSIILVCRKRAEHAPTIGRREFIRELNIVLPDALDEMTKGAGGEHSPVAPVDLSQAIIGPGMAVFSKYAAVLEANGDHMTVRTALQLINRFLAEDDFDADTQWCLRWFEQHGWAEGVFGEADVLARSKSISVSGLAEAGVILSGGGKVGLRKWADYPTDWDPSADVRQPVWETLHHLIRALKQEGESGAGKLLAAVKAKSEATRQLAYRLYTLCERQGWAEDARAYNELITSWTGIESAAGQAPAGQGELFN